MCNVPYSERERFMQRAVATCDHDVDERVIRSGDVDIIYTLAQRMSRDVTEELSEEM